MADQFKVMADLVETYIRAKSYHETSYDPPLPEPNIEQWLRTIACYPIFSDEIPKPYISLEENNCFSLSWNKNKIKYKLSFNLPDTTVTVDLEDFSKINNFSNAKFTATNAVILTQLVMRGLA